MRIKREKNVRYNGRDILMVFGELSGFDGFLLLRSGYFYSFISRYRKLLSLILFMGVVRIECILSKSFHSYLKLS